MRWKRHIHSNEHSELYSALVYMIKIAEHFWIPEIDMLEISKVGSFKVKYSS